MQQAWSCQYSDLKTEPSSNSQFTPCKGHDLITSRHAVGQAEWWRSEWSEPSRSPKHPSRLIGMKPQDTSPNPLGLQDVHHGGNPFPFEPAAQSTGWTITSSKSHVQMFTSFQSTSNMCDIYIYIPIHVHSKATWRALSFIRTSWAICKPSATKSTSEV